MAVCSEKQILITLNEITTIGCKYLKIPEAGNRRGSNNTMAKSKKTKNKQTMIYKTIRRKIELHEPTKNLG